MDSLKFGRDVDGRWHVTQAPYQVEFTLSEICGANAAIVHAEGRRLVWCDEVWYLPTGYDVERGVLGCVMDRDER
ncbi:MAG TPA: hypothetical protein VGJ28_19505 [Micromonosporaceae bacterium]|jgi:hypothetical protein